MTTTTLITFLVRAPLSTRSVDLVGSWDNFTTTYSMQRDRRTGVEHWSGCHTFSNIICDGNPQAVGGTREGGLKMGGTYWYYYKLDDDIEFHNSAEPSTTACPMLPGQLVNVLHVPIALSGSRTRSASTSSELRTLNPSDKYMNPRPVPRPALTRLQTSPAMLPQPCPSDPNPASACSVPERSTGSEQDPLPSTPSAPFRFFRMQRKATLDSSDRSNMPVSAKPSAFRNPFRVFNRSPRSTSPDSFEEKCRTNSESDLQQDVPDVQNNSDELCSEPPQLPNQSTSTASDIVQSFPTELDLALRRLVGQDTGPSGAFTTLSFHRHRGRKSRSRSRDPSPLRSSLMIDEQHAVLGTHTLETLAEVQSNLNTPAVADMFMQLAPEREANVEKRLPTLPNTPSSAYPPSPSLEVHNHFGTLVEQMQSRFSASTVASDFHSGFIVDVNKSHFSAWSDDSISVFSPQSRHGSVDIDTTSPVYSTFEAEDQLCPDVNQEQHFTAIKRDSREVKHAANAEYSLPPSFSSSVAGSEISHSSASSVYDRTDRPPSNVSNDGKNDRSSWDAFAQYRLPADEYTSEITLKQFDPHANAKDTFNQEQLQEREITSSYHHQDQLAHSDSMQQLLNELSYLTDMISR